MRSTPSLAKPLAWLTQLQSWHLKRLASLTGVASAGSKRETLSILNHSLVQPRLPHPDARILSVDMGVKNLAFCLLEVRQKQWDNPLDIARSQTSGDQHPLVLTEWKRLDISRQLLRLAVNRTGRGITGIDDESSSAQDNAEPKAIELSSSEKANMYAPSNLCKVAYTLASEFIKYKPDVILIERQRFRSGGAPAILEWTVRVNMLESMLWASLETLRHEHDGTPIAKFPSVTETSPRRIGSFWLTKDREGPIVPIDILSQLPTTKRKEDVSAASSAKRSLEKKDKISLARRWLGSKGGQLSFDLSLAPLVSMFLGPSTSENSKPRRKKTAAKPIEAEQTVVAQDISLNDKTGAMARSDKLDDLADCLVQGVTFALWEENRRRVLRHKSSMAVDESMSI